MSKREFRLILVPSTHAVADKQIKAVCAATDTSYSLEQVKDMIWHVIIEGARADDAYYSLNAIFALRAPDFSLG